MAARKTRGGARRRRGHPGGSTARAGSRIARTLSQVAEDLTGLSASFALIGGLAVSARAEPRFTRDVDLAVAARSDDEAERLIYALRGRGYAIDLSIEQVGTGRLATVRTRPPGEPELVVDLLFASSGIEAEIVARAEELELYRGVRIPVARAASLIALKVLSRGRARPQDDLDLAALLANVDDAALRESEALLRLIAQRGFARGKKLLPELRRLVLRWRKV